MSQKSCCVPGCPTTSGDGVPLHRFPDPETNEEKYKSWINNIGGEITALDHVTVFNNRRVCRRHFEDCHLYPKNRLCKLAVPVLHIPGRPEVQGLRDYLREPLVAADNAAEHVQPSTSSAQRIRSIQTEPQRSYEETQRQPDKTQTFGSNCSERKKTPRKGVRVSLAQHKEFKLLLRKLRKAEKEKTSFKKQLIMAKKMTKTAAFNKVSRKMSVSTKTFCQMQVLQSGKKQRGRRFTLEEKILALSLYKPSPKSYRLLRNLCVLPSRRTLQNLLQKIPLKAGINDLLFDNLRKRVSKMPETHKYCMLLFDEMAIGPGVAYNKKRDELTGFVDNGEVKTTEYCDHVLVFMIRGAIKKFKQPVAYYFCRGSTKTAELKTQIVTVIKKLQATGLKVIATVCDQGTSNIAAVNQLIKATKENYLRGGEEFREEIFEVENEKIFPIFDPPHLMKGIRNNLITKNLKYFMKGKARVAKWEHIVALYNRAPGYKGVKLVPKLTAQHVFPDQIPKMRVKHCTQVFSKSVGAALGYMAESGVMEKNSTDTADLLMFFDNLFDSVNGSYSQVRQGKIYRTAVTPTSPHHKLWNESMPVLKSMQFENARNQGVVPSVSSWIRTVNSFKSISKYLSSKGMNSLLLRNFNQDALENFFGAIRAQGCSNIMPTATAFEGAFKTLLINNISSSHSVGSNCEKDDSSCLQSLKHLLLKPMETKTPTECEDEIDSAHLYIELLEIEELLKSRLPEHIERSAAIGYCSGWLARLAKKHVYKNCETCQNDLEERELLPFHKFIQKKEYEGKRWLCYPTRALFDFFAQLEHICLEILKTHSNIRNISNYIKLIINTNINVAFLSCTEHKELLGKYLLDKSTMFFIHNWCKDVNNVLGGKITFWDSNDPMKVKAASHFLKHKGRNRKRTHDETFNV